MTALSAATLSWPSTFSTPGQGFAPPPMSVAPQANPLRRTLSIGIAIVIQVAFVAGLMSAMGVKLPQHTAPLMVVNIETAPELPKEQIVPLTPQLAPPPNAINLPPMPEVVVDLPPPVNTPTTAITTAPKGAVTAEVRVPAESYETVMLRHINSHLRYPPLARARHQQGTVYVRFVMDRKGNVLSAEIEKSSRAQALDEEGLALVSRAQPLPAPPANITGEQIQLVIPINFTLK